MINLTIERRLGDWMRQRLPQGIAEFVMFVLKQGWACLFGGLLLIALIVTSLVWRPDWAIHRYDALFLFAIATQSLFLILKLENWQEAKVILLFHVTGTLMEIFKIHMGSWAYPEEGVIKLAGVPLFSGFMYAGVGSYMARVIRVFHMRFAPYPPFWASVLLAVAIYGNFYSHHFLPDIRLALFAATIILFWRTKVWFLTSHNYHQMPLPLAAFLSAFFLWLAENIGTMTGTWIYNGQLPSEMVRWGKFGSWYLLLFVSFVMVTLVFRKSLSQTALNPDKTQI